MKLFDIVGPNVVINPDALAIPAFNKLWQTYGPDEATKYITYITFKHKFDSPYVLSMYEADIEPRLKQELFHDSEHELPELVIEAEKAYVGFDNTISRKLLRNLYLKLEDVSKYLEDTLHDELDLKKIKELTDIIKNMSGVFKTISDLEQSIRAEEQNSVKVRGNAVVNPFEVVNH
jgi:hypothetical protein